MISKKTKNSLMSIPHVLDVDLSIPKTIKKEKKDSQNASLLVLSGDGLTGQFLDVGLGPALQNVRNKSFPRGTVATHISPRATMQTVCQMPRPMRGATPRYRPLTPFSL